MSGPLSGLRVVELGGIGPVPHAGMLLADLGAEVVEIVRPEAGARQANPADILRRGKLSVALDLKAEGAAGVVSRLVQGSGALIEGFRPGVAERLGMGPEECLAVNPGLVYGRMTGWGQDGPLSGQAGHDIDYIAVSGALGAVGPATQPLPPLNLVGDFGGGSMLLVVGVLSALRHAEATGEGQVVDAAMVDGSALLMAMHHGAIASGWWFEERGTNLFDGSAPFYTTYETADGEWMAVGALEPQFYARLLEGLGLADADLPPQMDRQGWAELRRRFADVFATRTRAEWEDVFSGSDACVVGVYSVVEAADHPHNRARSTFVDVAGVRQPAPAPRLSATRSPGPGAVPRPGEHTAAILEALGIGEQARGELQEKGTIP